MRRSFLKPGLYALNLLLAACLLPAASAYAGDPQSGATGLPPGDQAAAAGLYVEVQLAKPMKTAALKPGSTLEGRLVRDVYAGDRDVFPAGSTVLLLVGSLERRKRAHDDRWPGVVGLFTPRHQTYPVFRSASVSLPGGEVPINVSLISITRPSEVRPSGKGRKTGAPLASPEGAQVSSAGAPSETSGTKPKLPAGRERAPGQTLILEAAMPEQLPALPSPGTPAPALPPSALTLTAGTQAQVVLLAPLSASKNLSGDSFHARLIEPVRLGSQVVLPAGSMLDGRVVSSKPPRWLSRPGSLYLAITGLTVPGSARVPVAAHLTGAEVDQRSHLRLDAEGGLSGDRPGKVWMLINLGVAAGVSKEADDAFQVVIEALVSTATDASTAGTARIVAACASGIYMVTRHGRDVVLPRFTRLDVTFSRPLPLAEGTPGPADQTAEDAALQVALHR
jgi:hypothetical protein